MLSSYNYIVEEHPLHAADMNIEEFCCLPTHASMIYFTFIYTYAYNHMQSKAMNLGRLKVKAVFIIIYNGTIQEYYSPSIYHLSHVFIVAYFQAFLCICRNR